MPTPLTERSAATAGQGPRAAGIIPLHAPRDPAAQAQLAGLIAAMPDAVLVVDAAGIVRFVNPAAQAMFGKDEADFVGERLGFAVPPAGVAEIALVGGEDRFAELRTVACDWGGRPATLAMMRDVSTERRLAASLDRERAFAERRLRDALDATSSAIVLVGGAGRIELANRAAGDLVGRDARGLEGQPLSEVLTRPLPLSDVAAGHIAPIRRFARHADGFEVPVEIGFTLFDQPAGALAMLTMTDATRLVDQERSLREQNLHLASLNSELGQFAYAVSHDLKAPLATASSLLDFALEDLAAGEAAACAENIAHARDACLRNAGKVEALLAIARAGEDRVPVEEVDLKALIAGIWTDLTASQRSAPVLDVTLAGNGTFRTERQTLATILENLLSNAVRFQDPAKSRQRVAVTARVSATGLELDVSDNGIGIPAACHARVFAMFNRFSDASGSGLGLALVKKHVDRLHGHIRFDSDAGGTVFRIFLPVGMCAARMT